MKRRRRSMSPRMLGLAMLYGRALRWPGTFDVGEWRYTVDARCNVLKAVNTRFGTTTTYRPTIAA